MGNKTAKNLLGNRDQYNKYYGDFRGVDFSSDHTQVHDQRLAYAVNMYKDYQSGQGQCIETIPGFRRRVEGLPAEKIWGIHQINVNDNGATQKKVLIHCGKKLYSWGYEGSESSPGVTRRVTVQLGEPDFNDDGTKTFEVKMKDFDGSTHRVTALYRQDGESIYDYDYFNVEGVLTVIFSSSELCANDYIEVWVYHITLYDITASLAERKSVSFVFNNRLHIMDGSNYLFFCREEPEEYIPLYTTYVCRSVLEDAYVPTTYVDIIPSGENADAGTQKENRNMLSPLFKHTFYGDGSAVSFDLNESGATVEKVEVYGVEAQKAEPWLNAGVLTGWTFKRKGITYVSTNGRNWTYFDGSAAEFNEEDEGLYIYYIDGITVRFFNAPLKPLDVGYPENYSGIEVLATKQWTDDNGNPIENSILKCTLASVFDNRVFLSGNPDFPNRVFWSAVNDPTYFPVTNFEDMGVGDAPVTGMIPMSNTLMVLKGDTQQDGSVYFLTPVETGDDLNPKIYTSVAGLSGTGCLGACVNFLDDPVFISRLGLEAMGQLSVRLERAIEHRSSLIDAKLTTMDLSRASMVEWNGYLCILIDGKMFMADSRQRYTDETGVLQYEWYYLEDIGVWDDQYVEYRYATSMRRDMYLDDGVTPRYYVKYCETCGEHGLSMTSCRCGNDSAWISLPLELSEDARGEVVNPPDEKGEETETVEFVRLEIVDDSTDESGEQTEASSYEIDVFYHVRKIVSPYNDDIVGYEALLCTTRENYTGGTFRPATTLAVIDNNLFFGTENGIICSFNFDMRNDLGEIPKEYYTFDNRTIFCGVATKMDNCGVPHLTKNTVKKSTVIKTRTMQTSGAKIKVRTNRKPYEQIARISSGQFFFDNVDFSDFSFVTTEHNLFAVREKEKKWIEKQYFLYSDEYMKPFSLFYIAYRYQIVGRYKEPK